MEFEIVGFRKGNDGKDLTVRKKNVYTRILIRNKQVMNKYCPEQFEIVGISGAYCTCDLNLNKDYSKYIGYHSDGTKNGRTGSTFGNCPAIIKNDMKHDYYRKGNETVQPIYTRILVKNKHPQKS